MNLSRIIGHWAAMAPQKCAIHHAGTDLSYAELWSRIGIATAAMAGAHGIKAGDRVAYLGLNHPDFLVLLMALARLGVIAVPLNVRLAVPELADILAQSGTRLLLCDAPMRAAGEAAAREAGVAVSPTTILSDIAPAPADDEDAGDDAMPVLLVYTSGTTGKPKGALHTQANLLWNIGSAIAAQDIRSSDHLLNSLPMFHVGGLCIQLLPVLAAGGTVTLHARFDPAAWIVDVATRRPTLSLLVPATLKTLLEHPEWALADLSSLRFINTGSSIVPRAMIAAVQDRGIPVGQVYGATETGPVSLVLRAEDGFAHAGSVGKSALHVEVRLMAPDGSEVPPGATGEIWVRGKNVVSGYWNDPGNPAFKDGWFRTGDLAYRDAQGFHYVVGRLKDMIISGGENIYPAELENILADCTEILECAVIGQDDAKWGEVAVAVVVRRPGSAIGETAVLALFDGRLARFKHPRRVIFAEELPKTALGKVQKNELRDQMRQKLSFK